MNKLIVLFILGFFSFTSPAAFAAHVISDADLDKITGQTGIVLNVVLDTLIGENYSQLTEEEKVEVRQMIEKAFGPLSLEEVEQVINSHQLFAEMIRQLPEEDRERIEEAFEIITAELQTTTPVDFLTMTDGGRLTADNLDDWAHDKVSKILIAQQIINDMIQALSPDQYQQMMIVEEIVNNRFDTLKQ